MSNRPNRLTPKGLSGFNNNQAPRFQVNINDLEELKCYCGNAFPAFAPAFSLRYATALQSPTGQPHIVQIPAGFICAHCGAINQFEETETNKDLFPQLPKEKEEG